VTAIYVKDRKEALQKVQDIIPQKSEVLTMSSVTLDESGISEVLNSDRYVSIRNKIYSLDREKDAIEMRKLGSTPEYAVGSANAITKDGKLLFASFTGSQIPAYSYGANKVVLVVSANKITADIDDAYNRVNEYVLPLESKRAQAAYGVKESRTDKWLVIEKELNPARITVVIVGEKIGY